MEESRLAQREKELKVLEEKYKQSNEIINKLGLDKNNTNDEIIK